MSKVQPVGQMWATFKFLSARKLPSLIALLKNCVYDFFDCVWRNYKLLKTCVNNSVNSNQKFTTIVHLSAHPVKGRRRE